MRPPLRILVVDDDDNSCKGLAELLGDEGHTVAACTNGAQALATLQAEAYDVLLTDLVMPGMSGLELVHRARTVRPQLRCLVMSGRVPDDAPDLQWIPKPIDFDQLLATLAG